MRLLRDVATVLADTLEDVEQVLTLFLRDALTPKNPR